VMNKLIIAVMLIGMLSGCDDNYDGLRVVDGDGTHYLLVHNLGDSYFVRDLTEAKPDRTSEANAKLRKTLADKEGY